MTSFEEITDFAMKSLPAAIGGLISIKWKKRDPKKSEWKNALESMFFAISGYTISLFFVPVLEIQNHKVEQAAFFGVGLIAVNVVGELYEEVLPIIVNSIKSKIKKFLGAK